MDKSKEIDALYKVLTLYEDVGEDAITLESYLNYLDKLYVKWMGIGNSDIYNTLRGLWYLGIDAGHRRVKSMVFNMIALVEKEC